MEDRDLPGWARVMTTLLAVAAGLWGLWCVVVGFVGGTMPLIGIEVEGSIFLGLFMLFIGEPILLAVARFVAMILMVPIIMVTTRRRAS
jgi:hypothetical protein